MTVTDANAMTIAAYADMSNNPMVKAIGDSLLDLGTAMTDIPFINKKTLIANGVRWQGNLPVPSWGSINSLPGVTFGTPTPYQEQAFIMRGAVKVDKTLVEDENRIGSDPRGQQVKAFLKGFAYDFNDKFINNTHTGGDANSFVGLRGRIDGGLTYGVWSSAKIDAGGVDLSKASMSAATANSFLEYLEQLLWTVDSPRGDGVTLYMNEVMARRFNTALRTLGTSGGFAIVKDQFDRDQKMFMGATIKDIGYKIDQATRIITNTETAAGLDGSSTFTSIYAVNYGEDHFHGWQYEPVNANDIGLLNDGVTYSTVIDWTGGLICENIRSVARLYDIKMS